MSTDKQDSSHSPLLDAERRPLPLPDSAELRHALQDASVPTLLMVYVHLTHDEGMLDIFKDYIQSPFSWPPVEIPAAHLEMLRAKLLHVLITPGAALQEEPSDALMYRMMCINVSETIGAEHVPVLFEQCGFKRAVPRRELPERKLPPANFKVLVVGAGLTGLVAGIKLSEAGYDYVTIEKNTEIGGTWWENRYPGVGVDTPSHFYSYSFEIYPDWQHYYPHGGDMLKYLQRVADKYQLRKKIRFETTVSQMLYDDQSGLWNVTVRTKDGAEEIIRVNAVINAHGLLNRWKWPAIAGREDFQGPLMHSAAYDAALDLRGKRVAVVGTGASAAQIIPTIAKDVEQLTVFQRSRHWVMNNPEVMNEVTDGVKFALRYFPYYREWFRLRVYWFAGDGLIANVVIDPDWPKDSPSISASNDAARQYSLMHMQSKFADRPDLIEKMTPDYPIFGKRITMDGGLLDAYKRDNVKLETGKIERILPHGIRMQDGSEYAADIIILATGFDLINMVGNQIVKGRGGRSLRDDWGPENPRAYMGITMPGYPNYFFTLGPNSGPSHAAGANMVAEVQVNYIIECLDQVVARNARSIEVKQAPFEAWNQQIEQRLQGMIWSHPKVNSYHKNSKGRIWLPWPYRLADQWHAMRGPKLEDYIID
jgi:4-hydroxyacetophenone monooxygenase